MCDIDTKEVPIICVRSPRARIRETLAEGKNRKSELGPLGSHLVTLAVIVEFLPLCTPWP